MSEYTITLNEKELVILNEALINLPFKVVAPLIERISKQLQEVNPEQIG